MKSARENASAAAAPRRKTGAAAPAKAQRSGPRSVTRLLNVLRVLAMSDEGASLAQLSLATGTPKTSVLALLRALVGAGYIVQRDASYTLGPEAFALGSTIIAQRKLARLARPVMQKAAEECGETVLLGEISAEGTHMVYIERMESKRPIRFIANVGERRPLYGSAGGRALLAFQSEEFRKHYLAKTRLEPLNRKKVLTKSEVLGLLEEVRKTLLARTDEDVTEGVAGFASPIFDHTGAAVAALAIAAILPRGRAEAELMARVATESARTLSRILGHIES